MNKTAQKVIGYKFDQKISWKLDALSKSDNYHAILALLEDWSCILLAIIAAQYCFYLYPISLLIIGSRQRALSTIFHDAAHKRAAKNKKLNLLIGTIFTGFWLFQSLFRYKDSHVRYHHGYLGNKELDPDFQFYIENGLYDPHLTAKDFLLKHVVSTLLLVRAPRYMLYLLKHRISIFNAYSGEFILLICFWGLLFLSASHYKLTNWIFLYWIIPFFTTHMIIGYFIEMAEHYPLVGKSNETIYLARNRFSHWIEALFFSIHNENYHLVHHLRPAIPFWNMIKAHKIMLQDKKYATINDKFGGIFMSSNAKKSLIQLIISHFTNPLYNISQE